ncbi:MAG: hypothetical protein ACU0BS_08385 [Hasllibacter sp.]
MTERPTEPTLSDAEFGAIAETAMPARDLRRALENVALSADAKAVLDRLLAATVQVGRHALQIGRVIVSFALGVLRMAPQTMFGSVIALAMTALIGSVPIIGAALGALLAPLLAAFGIGMGALADMRAGSVAAEVERFTALFDPLAAKA